MKKSETYILEARRDGKKWELQAMFTAGQLSRFGVPFSPEVAIREAQSFMFHRAKDGFIDVRIIIEGLTL